MQVVLPTEELHALGVHHLATGETCVEVDLRLLATVQDDALALAHHCHMRANASQDVHSFLLVSDGDSDGASVCRLVLHLPLATVGVELVFGRALRLQISTNRM